MPASDHGAEAVPGPGSGRQLGALLELTKPRITTLVMASAATGYLVAAGGEPAGGRLAALSLGTAMASGGTNALNQWWERGPDGRMQRTRDRPLPSGRLSPRAGLAFGSALATLGVLLLWLTTTPLTAGLAAATVILYVTVYTPLKRVTAACTYVGAVPGALPVLGGWAAHVGEGARGFGPAGWGLFAVLLLWQLPHFFALEWCARKDYGRAGFETLAVLDPSGRGSSRHALVTTLLLVAVSFVPVVHPAFGPLYGSVASAAAVLLLAPAVGFLLARDHRWARRLFAASLIYLPLLFSVTVLDLYV